MHYVKPLRLMSFLSCIPFSIKALCTIFTMVQTDGLALILALLNSSGSTTNNYGMQDILTFPHCFKSGGILPSSNVWNSNISGGLEKSNNRRFDSLHWMLNRLTCNMTLSNCIRLYHVLAHGNATKEPI